uniref:Uncharacterized LOC111233142 n=2 Tax=Seriola dumerili TaxID=41447 RepID=A0A3B4T2U2_SERDU
MFLVGRHLCPDQQPGAGGNIRTKHSPPVSARITVVNLTWTHGNVMEREAMDGLCNVSKAAILRVIVTEKLTTAAQEILAVVERTVADYEEEASGFRQEIDRQRRQLEVLLHSEIKVETTDDEQLFPIFEPIPAEVSGGGGGGELHEEEQQHKIELSVEDDGSVGLLCYTGEHTGEGEEEQQQEEEESCERQALTPLQEQDHITQLDYEIASRLLPPTVQSDRRSIGKPRVSESQGQVDLRICILENSQIEVLSARVFQQCPVQELQCPHGLQEADFLDLLRSTFPQLAADKPFDFFTTDRSRTLQPLRVKTLTPEEICGTIRSIGAGNSALYIRLKTEEEHRATDEEFHPSQRKEAAADSPSDPTRPHTEYLNFSATADETVQSDRRRRRRRSSKPRSDLDLRIRILEDSQTDVLSTPVFQQCPVQELQCPHGLQEADFLDLLRSTFPQLAADKPFDFFTTDRSRTLQPLRVKTLTPEEICGTIRSIGAGNSALYIRLKTEEEHRATDEEFHPSQRKEAAADSPSDPTRPHTEYLNFSATADETVQSDRRRRRRRSSKPRSDLDLRIRILEDSQTDVLSTPVFQQCPVQELQCPHGLQEADFLDLLRSTFPQLAADKPFDFFTTDRSRTLQPLRVKTLTPEEICGTIRSIGAGNSALYIRLKPHEKLQVKTNHPPLQRKDVAAKNSPSAPDHTGLNASVGSDRKRLGRPRLSDILNHVDLRIRLLEDSQVKVLSARVFRKYPVQELRCPRGLQEADFLDLLRSTFPQLAADGPFDVLVADRTRMLQPLRVKTLTPEEVSSTMRFFGHSVLYIRLKAPEEKAHLPQGNVDAAKDSPSTSDPTGRHSSSVQQQEGNGVDFLFSCSTSEQQGAFTEEADDDDDEDEDCERSRSPSLWSLQCLLLSESEQDEEEVNDGDDDWRPEKTDENLRNKEPEKTTGKRRVERPRVRAKRKRVRSPRPVLTGRNGDAPLSCSICGALRWSTSMLIKHSWSHVDHPERQCGVCGEQSESTEQLRIHLQSHQKTHSCNICGKSFLSTSGFNGHIALHKGEKPHKCKICHKAFTQRGTLVNHMWVHTANKPHKCDICQISCVSKTKLESHRVKHTGETPYSCSTCSKPFRSLQTLSQHMMSHSGRKRLYDCDVCCRKFTSNKRLQSHLRRHSSGPTAAASATNTSGARPSW